jgi:hypothetical protein
VAPGRPITQDRALTAGEDGGEPSSLPIEPPVADRIHAGVHRLQLSALPAHPDLGRSDPRREHLAPGDQAALARRDGRDPGVSPKPSRDRGGRRESSAMFWLFTD